jgi:L-fuculose-phosphate aldolase
MRLLTERQLIADYGRRMTGDRLVVGTSGNLSIRVGDLMAVTPAGHAYDTLTPELVCVQHLDGSPVEGALAPTSELPFHQLIYQHTDAAAVVHTHSVAATVVSTVVEELPTIHYILAVMGGPIRVAPYATFGSQELAGNVVAAIEGRSGVLLANHGAITYGPTIEVAYDRALYLEWVAEVWLRAHSLPGFTPRILGDAEMAEVYAKIQGTYGTTGRPLMADRPRSSDPVPEVLFVCVHNAGRSQMAAALLDHHANGRVRVRSAGSAPGERVNPAVVAAMAEWGIDLSKEFPKPLTDESVRAADVVVTMGCGDACPIYPGKRYEDWELQDPAGQPVEVVRRVRDEIDDRVRRLLAGLVPGGG